MRHFRQQNSSINLNDNLPKAKKQKSRSLSYQNEKQMLSSQICPEVQNQNIIPLYRVQRRKNYSSIHHSPTRIRSKTTVEDYQKSTKQQIQPFKAKQFKKLVSRKLQILKQKHRIKQKLQNIHTPNILNIEQTSKDRNHCYIRKMEDEMVKSGNGYLIPIMEKDLKYQCKPKNYLTEIRSDLRRERNYLVNMISSRDGEQKKKNSRNEEMVMRYKHTVFQ